MFNVFSSYDQREQTLSEPLLRDFTNVDRGTRGDFFLQFLSVCPDGCLFVFSSCSLKINTHKSLFVQVKWFEQQRELRRVKRDVPIEQHVKKRDFGDGPDPVKLTFDRIEKIPSNINYLFSRNSATGWRTISGTGSLPR